MLPDVLARPPWPAPRKRAVLTLTPPPREERVVWEEGEAHAWAHPGGGVDRALTAAERDAIVGKLEAKEIVRIDAATNLEVADLQRVLRACEPRFIEHYGIARAALAKGGIAVVEDLLALVARAPSCALEALAHVDSLRVATRLANDMLVLPWARHHPETAALALLPAALGPDGSARRAALKLLAPMREAHEGALRAAATVYGDAARAEVEALVAPEPLPSRAPALPAFVDLASLPMPRAKSGEPVGDEPRERLVQLLALLPLGAARDAVVAVKEACDAESLAALGGALAEAWVASGAEAKHKWALLAAGVLGDDVVARKLADWTVEWAKAGTHPRSRLALEALSLVGTDVALMHVDRVARTMKGALKTHATATLEAIAAERELTHEELADRLVPTLGLDPSGAAWLDFGPRRFRVSFDEALVPELFDESGQRLARLPRPTKTDDAARAARASALLKGLQSDAKKIAPDQVRRLERAMCTQRAWSASELRRFFVEHPLMVHLARRLVWVTEDGVAFRVTEDRTLASDDDREVTLGAARVRIAHPLAVVDRLAAWSALFDDYRIVQPFLQLARETFRLAPDDARESSLPRFAGRAVAGERFFTLKHRGWGFHDYAIGKALRGGFLAMLETEPGLAFLTSRPLDQTVGDLSLRRSSGGPATFAELDPIDASELIRDVELLVK